MSGLTDHLIEFFINNNLQLENGTITGLYGDAIFQNSFIIIRRIEDSVDRLEDVLNFHMNCTRKRSYHLYGNMSQKELRQ